jgi:hypothetical protein
VTADDYKAPLLAFWYRGLGRIASLTAEVDGKYSQQLNAWPGFQGFAIGIGRWLLGGEPPAGAQASLERQGAEAVVRVDLDPGRLRGSAGEVRTASATIIAPGDQPGDPSRRLDLAWVGEDTLEARFPVQKSGMYLGAVRLGTGAVLPLAPLSLPYSPEFEPRVDPKEGQKTLSQVARITGGIERTVWDDVFDASRFRNRQIRDLVIPLALMVLLLHVGEIAGRRLLLFAAAQGWLRGVRLPRWSGWPGKRPPAPAHSPAAASSAVTTDGLPHATPPVATPPKPVTSALSRAKAKSRDRLAR